MIDLELLLICYLNRGRGGEEEHLGETKDFFEGGEEGHLWDNRSHSGKINRPLGE